MNDERWEWIEGFKGMYEISDLGNIRKHYKNGKEKNMLHETNSKGYKRIMLHKEGKHYRRRVHRLVAEAFVQNPDKKSQINHIDGNKANNSYDNLEWCTQQENLDHAMKNGLIKTVEINIEELKDMYLEKAMTQREIAKKIGCSVSTICTRLKKYGITKTAKQESAR